MSNPGFVHGTDTALPSTFFNTTLPTYDYGYGTWNTGTNRGYESYGYGYGYGQDNTTNYGYDSFSTDNSRAALSNRDLYRSGYDYSEIDPGMEMAYQGHYAAYREQLRLRSAFSRRAQGWARDHHRANRPVATDFGPVWDQRLGAQAHCVPASSRPPSLFSQNIIPEYGLVRSMRASYGKMCFGFNSGLKRMRRTWKTWGSPDFRPQKKKKKKRKQFNSPDETDSKATNGSDNSDSDNDEGNEGEGTETLEVTDLIEKSSKAEGEDEEEEGKEDWKADAERGVLTIQEEISQIKRKLQAGRKINERQKKRQRDRLVERIQFVCSLCKYRTFYEDEMTSHWDSKFHKEHFKFVGGKLPKQTADFLEEYVNNKTKKTEERRRSIEDLSGVIQKIYKDQDLTQEISPEHFMKKVEAAHCAACDLFIPMQQGIIQKHLKTTEHNRNRRLMMDQSKKSSLVVARSILNNKLIGIKLERYLKGENPFADGPDDEKGQEEGERGESRLGGNMEKRTAAGEVKNKKKEEKYIKGQGREPEEGEGVGARELTTETQALAKGSSREESALNHPSEEESCNNKCGGSQG
ncbi:A-kinase anchor protein 8-like [Tachyglossus aculeatus]|uniref:A-kinase anchor protein 8-like n=1 Tax=Tachyglossus aculeatus TaxID=9261 RepID=UPI0018F5CDD5|nr:A-kinase anchor protein 8-like [Tachyglossus aculeatus]